MEDGDSKTNDLRWLAIGPSGNAKRYKKFVGNGFRFRTISVDNKKKTQNSGVIVTAKTTTNEDRTYYGQLVDIIELSYHEDRKVVFFKCKWVQGSAIKEDEYGITIVNSKQFKYTKEPFILASQSLQVFYVENPREKGWKAAIKVVPRDFFNMKDEERSTDKENTFCEVEQYISNQLDELVVNVDNVLQARPNLPPIEVSDQPVGEASGVQREFDDSDDDNVCS